MSTIIAHGKSQWNRANKNERADIDILAELEQQNLLKSIPQSRLTEEAILLKTISNTLESVDCKIISEKK